MRLTTLLLPLLAAANHGLAAPVADKSVKAGPYHALKTVVTVSRHRGALESFIASEEVSTSITQLSRPPKSKSQSKSKSKSAAQRVEGNSIAKPPAGLLVTVTRPIDLEAEKHEAEEAGPSWAVALLQDVYADYRSVAPCWRQGTADASEKIQNLAKSKAELLIFLGIGFLITAVLILEAIYQNFMSLRRRLAKAGEIRLEGPERALEAEDDKGDEKAV